MCWRQPAQPWIEPGVRLGGEFAAPLLLFSLVGICAPVIYRAAIETARSPTSHQRKHPVTWAALLLAYVAAAPAQRLVTLFGLLAAQKGEARPAGLCALEVSPRVRAAAAVATIALALLIAIW